MFENDYGTLGQCSVVEAEDQMFVQIVLLPAGSTTNRESRRVKL